MTQSGTLQLPDLPEDEAVRFAAKPEIAYHGTDG
jgi:hypothetical protein